MCLPHCELVSPKPTLLSPQQARCTPRETTTCRRAHTSPCRHTRRCAHAQPYSCTHVPIPVYTTTPLKPCLQQPCLQDSELWFSCNPANHSVTWGLQAGGHQGGWGPRHGWCGVHSMVWKRLVRPSLLSNLFSPAAKEPISSGFSFQISQHAMARRLHTVYLEKARKIVCIIRAGTRAALEGVLRRSPGLAADASSKSPPPSREAPGWGPRTTEVSGWAAGPPRWPPWPPLLVVTDWTDYHCSPSTCSGPGRKERGPRCYEVTMGFKEPRF